MSFPKKLALSKKPHKAKRSTAVARKLVTDRDGHPGENQSEVSHQLDPRAAGEIAKAGQILRRDPKFSDKIEFVAMDLHEPEKNSVLNFHSGDRFDREAFAVLFDRADSSIIEAVVSVTG